MELDSLLIKVQGALITLKRNHGLQKNPQDKNIENTAFYQALERIQNACIHSERDMRRIHLYLLINSDLKFNKLLLEDENFSHIVSTTPTVDKYLLVETFLMLEFEKYINETILFGHLSISVEYLDVISKFLKTHRSKHHMPLLESFIAIIHHRLSLLASSDNGCGDELQIERRILSSYYERLLTLFSPPHDEYKLGYVIKSLLSLLCSFLDHHFDFPIPADSDHSLYIMSLPSSHDDSNAAVTDFDEMRHIRLILSMLKSNLLLVDLTTWMDWFEMKWKSSKRDNTSRNMQQVVGEVAYLCLEKLHNASIDNPDLEIIITVISGMARKPYSEDEEIQKTEDLVEILQKVKDESLHPNSRKKWLIALLSIPKSLTENSCYQCIEEFGSYFSNCEELLLLLERVGELISNESLLRNSNSENYNNEVENIKRTLLKIFSQVSLEDQGKIMAEYFAKYDLSHLFATNDYDKTITEYLNKVVDSSEEGRPISESFVLCLQYPVKYFQGLLGLAICNGQIAFVMTVLKPLSNFCQLRLESQGDHQDGGINKNARFFCEQINYFMKRRHWNDAESSNFVQLVTQVQKCAILCQDDIFQEILHPNIEEFLRNKSWNSVDLCIKTIYELVSKSYFNPANHQNPAVLLAVLLQVLVKGRQEMREEFSSSAASTCELLASFLPLVVEKFIRGNYMDGKSLEWLKSRVLCSSPLEQIYFSCLQDCKNAENICKSSQEILMLQFFQSTEDGETKLLELLKNQPSLLGYSLFKLLPSCTTSEWINVVHALKQTVTLCQSEREQRVLISSLIFTLSNVLLVLITVLSKKNSSEKKEPLHIIELYMKNFVRIIKEEFWPCTEYVGVEESCKVFQKIVNLLELIPIEGKVQESCGLLVLNILSDIIQSISNEKLENYKSDPMVLQLATSISLLNDMESRKCLSRMLMENIEKNSSAV